MSELEKTHTEYFGPELFKAAIVALCNPTTKEEHQDRDVAAAIQYILDRTDLSTSLNSKLWLYEKLITTLCKYKPTTHVVT